MHHDSLWKLCKILLKPKKSHSTISCCEMLSMGLRWMAGGDPLNIPSAHHVEPGEVLQSVWMVVNSVNKCSELDISFPESHA